jgi:hypothetical protein
MSAIGSCASTTRKTGTAAAAAAAAHCKPYKQGLHVDPASFKTSLLLHLHRIPNCMLLPAALRRVGCDDGNLVAVTVLHLTHTHLPAALLPQPEPAACACTASW